MEFTNESVAAIYRSRAQLLTYVEKLRPGEVPDPVLVIAATRPIKELFTHTYVIGKQSTAGEETDVQLGIQMLEETALGFMKLTMIYAQKLREMKKQLEQEY